MIDDTLVVASAFIICIATSVVTLLVIREVTRDGE
jgi:hypothetical protein